MYLYMHSTGVEILMEFKANKQTKKKKLDESSCQSESTFVKNCSQALRCCLCLPGGHVGHAGWSWG